MNYLRIIIFTNLLVLFGCDAELQELQPKKEPIAYILFQDEDTVFCNDCQAKWYKNREGIELDFKCDQNTTLKYTYIDPITDKGQKTVYALNHRNTEYLSSELRFKGVQYFWNHRSGVVGETQFTYNKGLSKGRLIQIPYKQLNDQFRQYIVYVNWENIQTIEVSE